MSIVVCNNEQSNSFLSNIDDKCVQQAAVDVRLENIWRMDGVFSINEDSKTHRNKTKLDPIDDEYVLDVGVYECSFDHSILIGDDEAGLVVTRSTLVRNGIFLVSGLWDPGFEGRGGCCLHVTVGQLKIKKGTRIGQFVLWKVANPTSVYDGDYGIKDGIIKASEAQYFEGK